MAEIPRYFEVFGSGTIDCIIGCGRNPRRPIHGEDCKALLTMDNGLPMVYPIAKAWSEFDEIGHVYLSGPKKRLQAFVQTMAKQGLPGHLEKILIAEEDHPGDADAIIDNAIKVYKENPLSTNVLYSTCDIKDFGKPMATKILTDIIAAMADDKAEGKTLGDFYYTVGRQSEDILHFRGKLFAQERPGVPFGKDKELRFGSVHIANIEQCLKSERLFKELLNFRKMKEDYVRAAKHFWEMLGDGEPSKYRLTEARILTLKMIFNYAANYVSKYGVTVNTAPLNRILGKRNMISRLPEWKFHIPAEFTSRLPVPYFDIPIEGVERTLSRYVGFKVRMVETTGSADIDNLTEFLAAKAG